MLAADAEMRATRAVDDHAEALRARDTGIVATLPDELLREQGLHVPPTSPGARFGALVARAPHSLLPACDAAALPAKEGW